ncbi:hypothetical protein [Oceanispirochaeta sp. M2]|nr:hypothetical protein [Oceanispirochaeta sp. M2]MBF9018955.1 hypothetical protein [Oceanispirochaeta sp. M2]
MALNTLPATRKAMAKLKKEYEESGEKDHTQFRNLIYFYATFLNYWKLEKDLEIEKRLDEL